MNTERTKQILNNQLSANNVNNDTYLHINVENSQRLLPINEINKVVNIAERFNKERQRCSFYRIIGTINSTMSNPLFNLSNPLNNQTNEFTWSWFNSIDTFLDTSYPKDNNIFDDTDLSYPSALKTFLKEKDGWFGAYDPDITKSGLCNFLDMEPKRERFSLIADKNPINSTSNQQPIKNWELTITYPSNVDKSHNMVNGGLLITSHAQAIVSTRNMTAFGLSCKHNLAVGDTVNITGTNGYDGQHVIVRTGLDNGDLKEYFFVIDKPFIATNALSSNSRIKKVINGIESEYYFRLFKKIKTRTAPVVENDDYEVYKLGFSENFFNDSIVQFVFNEDIDISDLKDNLGRPLSEIYLTIVKTDSNGLFTKVSSGIETPYDAKLISSNTSNLAYLRNIPTIHRIHNGTSGIFTTHIALEDDVKINNTNHNNEFYGDLVEYNINTLLETVLVDVVHRFNTVNREGQITLNYVSQVGKPTTPTPISPVYKQINLGPRHEGYYYKAHHKFNIKQFSNYIEVGDIYTEGIPSYAVDLGDGRIIWRDMLEIGFNESDAKPLDYPFLNNAHYLYDNFCFTLKRQDPFANWGLYYGTFPEDPVGDKIIDKFNVKTEEEDDCQKI